MRKPHQIDEMGPKKKKKSKKKQKTKRRHETARRNGIRRDREGKDKPDKTKQYKIDIR